MVAKTTLRSISVHPRSQPRSSHVALGRRCQRQRRAAHHSHASTGSGNAAASLDEGLPFLYSARLVTLHRAIDEAGDRLVATDGSQAQSSLGYYAIRAWGVKESHSNVTGVNLTGYVRQNSTDRPYGVANDYVASTLGTAIGLEVPPGRLIRLPGDEVGYLSMGFSDKGDRLPPALLGKLAAERPWDAAGILAFDQWIYNTDRHDENLAYASDVGLAIFDHDRSVINTPPASDPYALLNYARDQALTGHKLAPHIVSDEYFASWSARIASIDIREIRRAVAACQSAKLISSEMQAKVVDFLHHRQSRIDTFILRTRLEFNKVTAWSGSTGEVSDVG